jgi:hypothetical protein
VSRHRSSHHGSLIISAELAIAGVPWKLGGAKLDVGGNRHRERCRLVNRQQTIQALLQWLAQSLEIAAHSYDYELKFLSRDGLMSDAELEALMIKLGDNKQPLDEVRDFSLARQALKELESGRSAAVQSSRF